MIGLILLQQGKGAEMGASFGSGASQSMFGSQGSVNFFTKLTALLAVGFFSTSFSLAIIAKNQSSIALDDGLPTVVEETMVNPAIERPMIENDVPFVEQARSNNESDIPVSTDK
jgi:preprotein translocase subunit SecG